MKGEFLETPSIWRSDVETILETRKFLFRLLNPEDLGLAVSGEVRNSARILLGIPTIVAENTNKN